jgi:hypothetical protein
VDSVYSMDTLDKGESDSYPEWGRAGHY